MTSSAQDYIKAVYSLSHGDEPVHTKRIARHLGTSLPAVSKMLKVLASRGWIEHTPYYGVRLTAKGTEVALEMVRHHRLLERYLMEHLGYSEERVHAEAEVLEHYISEEFEDRIAELMGHPETCPHGKPIPAKGAKEAV